MKWYQYNIQNLTDEEYDKWYSLMNEDKQCRVDRFRFADDKKRTVAGEMLARKVIAEWCGATPKNITFDKKEHGKPYAKDLNVEFNISHSGAIVVCAVDDKPIGIDIERIRPIDLKVVKHICMDNEINYLFGHVPTEKDFKYTTDVKILTRFFEFWTKKEAYGKCIGDGLLCKVKEDSCSVNTFYDIPDYIMSICTHNSEQ